MNQTRLDQVSDSPYPDRIRLNQARPGQDIDLIFAETSVRSSKFSGRRLIRADAVVAGTIESPGPIVRSGPRPDHTCRSWVSLSSSQTAGPQTPPASGRAAARLKADGDANRSMLLLTAKAAREIVEAIEASAESFAKAMEANTETLKRIEGKIDGQTEALKRIEGKTDGQTET